MTPAECPDDESLAAFVERRAAEPAIVEEHIDTCDACRMVVAHLAALRVASSSAGADADELTATSPARGPARLVVPSVRAGTKLDRYVVQRELGRGGMGVVLAAHDPELDRPIALKIVRPGSDDPLARQRLLREARAMARLAHPNVVTIHDVGELDDGRVFLAMELVAGTTLRRVKLARRATVAETLALFEQAGRGLAAAHAVGLVHRDFKPDNVLVGEDGRVRVTDFGLARGGLADDEVPAASRARPADAALTATGAVMGTPAYMAPEQHLGEPALAHADQFAFAVALFEALTGARAYPGDTYDDIAARKLHGEHAPWPADCDAPVPLRTVIDRALSRGANDRFPTMDALLTALASASAPASAPARRRWLPTGAVLTTITLAAAALTLRAFATTTSSAPPDALCTTGASTIAPAWSEPRSAALSRSLSARGVTQPVIDATLAALDAHARAWIATHDTSCRATRVDHSQADTLYLARAACLRRRRAELYETVEALTHNPAPPDAVFALHPLGSMAACDDLKTLAASEPPPADAALSGRLDDIHSAIARLRAAPSPARSRELDALVAAAGATKIRAAHAEAVLLKGEMENDDRLLREALLSAEASRDDELAGRARVALVRGSAHTGSTPPAERAASAVAALARLERPELEADVHEAVAFAELRKTSFRAARAESERALQRRAASPPSCGRLRGVGDAALEMIRLEAVVELGDGADAPEALRRAGDALTREAARPEMRARWEVLAGRVALATGTPLDALAAFDRARALLATLGAADLARVASSNPLQRGDNTRPAVARRATAEARLFSARAYVALERTADAEKELEGVLHELHAAGHNLEPAVESRALGDLARLAKARAFERASRAVELIEDEKSPVLAEALVALGEALVAQGKARDALVPLGRADVIARGGPLDLRADCAAAFARAATPAAKADATAVPRAREVVRRVIADAPPGSRARARAERALAALE